MSIRGKWAKAGARVKEPPKPHRKATRWWHRDADGHLFVDGLRVTYDIRGMDPSFADPKYRLRSGAFAATWETVDGFTLFANREGNTLVVQAAKRLANAR